MAFTVRGKKPDFIETSQTFQCFQQMQNIVLCPPTTRPFLLSFVTEEQDPEECGYQQASQSSS